MSTLEELVAVLQDAGSDPSRLATAAENLHKQIDALVERRTGSGSRKRKWSQRCKDSLPNECLLDALRFLSRNDLDCVQLASKQLSVLVSRKESSEPVLRRIATATVGEECWREGCSTCELIWLPVCKIKLDDAYPKRSVKSPVDLKPYLRMSYVEELILNEEPTACDGLLRLFYDDSCRIAQLDFPSATIREVVLQSRDYPDASLGCLQNLQPELLKISGNWPRGEAQFTPDDHFLRRVASNGINRLVIDDWCYDPIPTETLLVFCFAEPVVNKRKRHLSLDPRSADSAMSNLMQPIRVKASELDSGRAYNFSFMISGITTLDIGGHSTYECGDGSYVMNDFDNKVKLKITHRATDELEVHVTCSSAARISDIHH